MKVGFVAEQFPPETVGGLGTHCKYLTEALKNQGVDVKVAAPYTDKKNKEEAVRIKRFKAPYLNLLLAEELKNWGDPSLMTGLLQFNILAPHKLSDCDIIHCHDFLSILSLGIAKDLGKKTVLTMHSIEDGRQGVHGGSQIVRGLERMGWELADKVITVSNAMKTDLVRLGYPEERISVIYNGIDTTKYKPKKTKKNTRPQILHIGRLDWVKGADTLIRAAAKMEEDCDITILGSGGWEGYLKGLKGELKTKNIKFMTEFIPEKEKIELIAKSDITVFPSRYEPFGIVALEGMAMGKPTLVGDVGGLREFVPQETRFDPGDSDSLAILLDRFCKDKKLREETGKRYREIAEKFSWDEIAKKTKAVYESL
jgi:glycogen(starch) synthase